ncbi:MAG: sensor histidine kinase [Candidatus Geothermincolia bacterium]
MGSESDLRVLIIEDEPEIARSISTLLGKKVSARPDVAEDCASARAKLSASSYDLVTLDYQLPDCEGLDFLREITSLDEPPPVIMVTGHGDENTAVEAFRSGAAGYVVKDARMGTLLVDAVHNVLSRTALEKAERALCDSDERYRTIVENSHDLIWMLDCEGHFTFVNPPKDTFRSWYSVTDLTGIHFSKQVHPDDLPRIQRIFEETLAGNPRAYETRAYDEDGKLIILSVNTVPLYSEDTVVGTLSFGRDITDQKVAEENLRHINEELEAYAHTVSHDLKGPVAAITLAVELLDGMVDKTCGDDVPETLELLKRNVAKVQNRIEVLLRLAESGQVPTEREEVDVGDVVAEILEELSGDISAGNIDVSYDKDMGLIIANREQIRQIFSNLMSNAIKHNDNVAPAISITYLGTEVGGVQRYLLRDNGSGIEAADLERIFTPFFKGNSGETGVGLSIARKIARVYAGDIRAYNAGGACFELKLKSAT